MQSGRLCRCGSDTVTAGATDLRRRGPKPSAIAAIATLRQPLGGRLRCAPVPVAGHGNPRLDSGHIARRGPLRHFLTKQQERQDEEFLHCSHFPIIRKHYNDFRDAVKLPKEGAVIRQHRRRHAAYGIAGIIGRKPPAIAANAASCLQFLRVGGGRFALLPAWVTGGDGFSSFHRYTYARVCARVTLRGQVSIDQISDICERLQFHYWGMVRGRGSGRNQSGQDNTVSHAGNIC